MDKTYEILPWEIGTSAIDYFVRFDFLINSPKISKKPRATAKQSNIKKPLWDIGCLLFAPSQFGSKKATKMFEDIFQYISINS